MSQKLLNPYQRNSVVITLRSLETIMRGSVADLANEEQGVLYHQKSSLSMQQRAQIEHLRDAVLAEINSLKQTLALPVETRDARSLLQGQLAVLTSDLYDIRAEKLIGFGEVSPELAPVLNPSVLRLIGLVQQMMDVVAGVERQRKED